jgi:hypothetical protein
MQTGSDQHPISHPVTLSLQPKSRNVKLITHLHLVPRLRMPPLLHTSLIKYRDNFIFQKNKEDSEF